MENTLAFHSVATVPPIRVFVAKAGLDGHDRGAKIIALIRNS
jgi:methylmalonyl-CoA mutase cobalamin-binding subunit